MSKSEVFESDRCIGTGNSVPDINGEFNLPEMSIVWGPSTNRFIIIHCTLSQEKFSYKTRKSGTFSSYWLNYIQPNRGTIKFIIVLQHDMVQLHQYNLM